MEVLQRFELRGDGGIDGREALDPASDGGLVSAGASGEFPLGPSEGDKGAKDAIA